ncbi:hypothetical protein BDP27DRAFT_1363935 [Rhodocollybia butyracea]|uniref:Uncharacterized protein n=1 Tax=Rhodocollybia butyracea TaxID=206335 RepID=A0A9P5PT50_9AGAR|nr:hypothetical protein BDP27DRAFT_1363935 [Rhodocollybia butyracea]
MFGSLALSASGTIFNFSRQTSPDLSTIHFDQLRPRLSLFAIALFDALKPEQNNIITAALIFLLSSIIAISIWLLHRCKTQILTPLPHWTRAQDHDERRRVAESVEHSLLMSKRLLSIVYYGNPSNARWASVGVPLTLVLVIAFGKCLLFLGVQEHHWGYFRDIYWVVTSPIQSALRILRFVGDIRLGAV